MKQSLFVLSIGFLLMGLGVAAAKTPDGKPPSVETVCDNETGAAFGLCNAYCEAMDCDSPNHHASDQGCESVRRNFERKTGRPMPCEVSCPCTEQLSLFGDIVNGVATVEMCLADSTVISALTGDGSFVLVSLETVPPLCSANLEAPFIELTTAEAIACRDVLRRAAEAQGVACEAPE